MDILATTAIETAKKAANEKDLKLNIAIVDQGANLVSFLRMDGAWLGSIDVAIKKAKTAVFFEMATEEIGKLSQPGSSLYGIEHSNGGLMTFPGGLPIRDAEGKVIGGIGVSGSTVENDAMIARAGLSSITTNEYEVTVAEDVATMKFSDTAFDFRGTSF